MHTQVVWQACVQVLSTRRIPALPCILPVCFEAIRFMDRWFKLTQVSVSSKFHVPCTVFFSRSSHCRDCLVAQDYPASVFPPSERRA